MKKYIQLNYTRYAKNYSKYINKTGRAPGAKQGKPGLENPFSGEQFPREISPFKDKK